MLFLWHVSPLTGLELYTVFWHECCRDSWSWMTVSVQIVSCNLSVHQISPMAFFSNHKWANKWHSEGLLLPEFISRTANRTHRLFKATCHIFQPWATAPFNQCDCFHLFLSVALSSTRPKHRDKGYIKHDLVWEWAVWMESSEGETFLCLRLVLSVKTNDSFGLSACWL